MTMTLYGTKGSGAAAIDLALGLLGIECRLVDAASWLDLPGNDELRRVNSLAQVPTLVFDDGSVMGESAAILIELGLRDPDGVLLSREPARRAQQIRGLVFIAANCYAGIGILDFPDRWYPEPDETVRAAMQVRGKARLHELWCLFADQFPAAPWLSGDRLGALDLLAAVVSRWSGSRAALAVQRPAFHALMERIERAPGVAEVWARHWPPAA